MRLPFRQIRHQVLFLLSSFMLATILLFGIFATSQIRRALTSQTVEAQAALAQAIHQGLSMSFDEIIADLQQLSEDPRLQHLDRSAEKPLNEFLVRSKLFTNAMVYDLEGFVCASTERSSPQDAAKLVGRNLLRSTQKLSDMSNSLKAALNEKKMQISTLHSSLRQGQLLVIYFPIRAFDRNDCLRGILSMGIHLDGALLHEMLTRFSAKEGFILLTDRNGKILARQGETLPENLARASVEPYPIPGTMPSTWSMLGNEECLVTTLAVTQLDMVLLVGRSKKGIVGTVNSLAANMLGIALILLLGAGFVAWLLADSYLSQILALLKGLRQIGSGVLSSRVEVVSDDELGEASQAFNTMAEGLEWSRLVEELWRDRWNKNK
jgi:HAMP domain-containing protein